MLIQKSLSQVWLAAILTLLISSSVQAYELTGWKWLTQEVPVSVGIVGSSPTGGTWSSGMSQAMSAWNSRVTGVDIIVGENVAPCGTTTDLPFDFKNGTGFASTMCGDAFGSTVLAVTVPWVRTDNGEAVDMDIIFNTATPWDIFGGSNRPPFDFRRTAIHELGHVLGLGHETDVPAIMQPFYENQGEMPVADDIAGVNFLYPASTPPIDPIKVSLEEPSQDQVASGVTNVRGWAVATTGINRIEIWLDGSYLVDVPSGGSRGDVGNANPLYPDSANSGFSMAFAWGFFSQGAHTMTARAFDNAGGFENSTHSFTITKFDNPFIKPPATVLIDTSSGGFISSSEIILNRVVADGKSYEVKLRWNTQSQQFNVNQITPIP